MDFECVDDQLHSSIPNRGQVQQQILKFQQQQQINKTTNSFTNFKKIESLNNSFSSKVSTSDSDQSQKFQIELNHNDTNLKQNRKNRNNNKFELKTSKGKALEFTITSDDPSESDIEEVKSILKRTCSNNHSDLFNSNLSHFMMQDKNGINELSPHFKQFRSMYGSVDNILAASDSSRTDNITLDSNINDSNVFKIFPSNVKDNTLQNQSNNTKNTTNILSNSYLELASSEYAKFKCENISEKEQYSQKFSSKNQK